jgi:hypothetical protein
MPDILVEDKKIVKEYTVIKLCIQISELVLNKTATFMVDLECDTRDIVDRYYYTLTEEEYSLWGNDDGYVIDLILNHYGFERKE